MGNCNLGFGAAIGDGIGTDESKLRLKEDKRWTDGMYSSEGWCTRRNSSGLSGKLRTRGRIYEIERYLWYLRKAVE